MKPHPRRSPLPGHRSLSPLYRWDPELVQSLIEENRHRHCRPRYLVLGKREARMLRRHLGISFGPASLQCLDHTFYMGLEVVEDPSESLMCVAGSAPEEAPPHQPHDLLFEFLNAHSRWRFSA